MNIWEEKYNEEIEKFKKEYKQKHTEYLSDELAFAESEIYKILEGKIDTELLGKVLDVVDGINIGGPKDD